MSVQSSPLTLSPASSVSLLSRTVTVCIRSAVVAQLHLASTCFPDTPSFLFSLQSKTPWKNHCLKLPLLYFFFFFNLSNFFKWKYSWFAMLCPYLLSSKVTQLYTHIYILSYILFYYGLSRAIIFLCAVCSRTCCMSILNVIVRTCQPQTPSVPTSPSPPLLHFSTLSSYPLAGAIPSKQLLWMSTIIFFNVVCLHLPLLPPTSLTALFQSPLQISFPHLSFWMLEWATAPSLSIFSIYTPP